MNKLVSAAFAAAIAVTSVSAALAQPGRDDHRSGRDDHQYGRGDHQAVQHSDWRKGHRIAHEDWNRGQPVDWRAHHLARPRRGYEWREVDGNWVMAAAATGLIASAIAAH